MATRRALIDTPVTRRVVARLRQALEEYDLSHQDVADLLQHDWTRDKVTQKLNRISPITIDELDQLAFAARISTVEAIRDHGYEFCAEMTPLELQIWKKLRELPVEVSQSLLLLLSGSAAPAVERRHASKLHPILGRPRTR